MITTFQPGRVNAEPPNLAPNPASKPLPSVEIRSKCDAVNENRRNSRDQGRPTNPLQTLISYMRLIVRIIRVRVVAIGRICFRIDRGNPK
uniref:Uncharacterized protein n=1 Tax=Panagrellus redivivus TaxID=6233 RepID=A0A7E4W5A5_PANRE